MKSIVVQVANWIRNKTERRKFAVRIETAVGQIPFVFNSLDKARKFSCGRHAIYELFDAKQSAASIQQMTSAELRKLFK